MPCFKLFTNLPKTKISVDLIDKLVPILSRLIKKPVDKIICAVVSDTPISFGGDSKNPGAIANFESVGHLGSKENQTITEELSQFFEKELGIPSSRFFISFYDVKPWNVAKDGLTGENQQKGTLQSSG